MPSAFFRSDVSTRFVGTWMLQVVDERSAAGEWIVSGLFGPDPLGVITYDVHGNMTAQLTRRDRSIADPAAGTVTHHRSVHVNAELGNLLWFGITSSMATPSR